jgi:hypothetical protein
MLEISFAERSLRSLCENRAKAEAAFGVEAAINLQRRLADLRAATSIRDLIFGAFRRTGEKLDNVLIFDLGGGFSMTVVQNHMVAPLLKSGRIDWKKVRRVKVLKIERTHHGA